MAQLETAKSTLSKRWRFLLFGMIACALEPAIAADFSYFTKNFPRLDGAGDDLPPLSLRTEIPRIPFIVVRHAESVYNQAVQEINSNQRISIDADLSHKGYDQAGLVAAKVEQLLQHQVATVSFIVSSPFQRALKTADICNKGFEAHNQKLAIYLHEGLKERSWGCNEGIILQKEDLINLDTSDAEKPTLFENRVLEALGVILTFPPETNEKGIPLIFSHSGVIKVLVNYCGLTLTTIENARPILFIPSQNNPGWEVLPLKSRSS